MDQSLKDKLLARAHVAGEDECWEWKLSVSPAGYGKFYSGRTGHFGRPEVASRVSYEVFNGPIPDGAYVCHRCDNRRCINPKHLFLGSSSDNHQDMLAKNRGNAPRGETHPLVKLTAEQVLEIRSSADPTTALAERYGVSRGNINKIRSGKGWKHLNTEEKRP